MKMEHLKINKLKKDPVLINLDKSIENWDKVNAVVFLLLEFTFVITALNVLFLLFK